MSDLIETGKRAIKAKRILAVSSEESRVNALTLIADALIAQAKKIITANAIDLENGKKNGLSEALLDRLTLDLERITHIAYGVRQVANEPCCLGKTLDEFTRPNGLVIQKVAVPLGVIGVIFEARPNVTADSAALCLKSGNACILRGGKEAINSNIAVSDIMRCAIERASLPADCVQLICDTSRDSAKAMMHLNGYIDVLIPRGGKGLICAVCTEATVPVIQTGAGTCHIYVDKDADVNMAANIILNAKTQRPSVCNACESMLIHKDIASAALPLIAERLQNDSKIPVEIRGDARVCEILPKAIRATDDDWGAEYLDYVISAKVVDTLDDACEHIFNYGTMHSECIITDNPQTAQQFMTAIDAAVVYVNASTRFTDGGEFGFGAEIGISTQKLHARGPLGLNELTSYKYKIFGNGQVR